MCSSPAFLKVRSKKMSTAACITWSHKFGKPDVNRLQRLLSCRANQNFQRPWVLWSLPGRGKLRGTCWHLSEEQFAERSSRRGSLCCNDSPPRALKERDLLRAHESLWTEEKGDWNRSRTPTCLSQACPTATVYSAGPHAAHWS